MEAVKRATLYTVLLLVILSVRAVAQVPDMKKQKNFADSVEAWADYCDFLLGYGDGAKEDYPGLIVAGKQGMQLFPKDSSKHQSLFSFYSGAGYEFTGELDSALVYYKVSEKYALKAKHIKRLMAVYKQLIGLGTAEGREVIANRMLKIADTAKSTERRMDVHATLYKYYRDKNQYEKAIHHNLELLHLRQDETRKSGYGESNFINTGVALTQIGDMYFRMGQQEKALEYFREALPYATNKYYDGAALLYNDILGLFLQMNEPDSARFYYNKIYGLMADGYDSKEALSYANRNYAEYYSEKGDNDKALEYGKKAYALSMADGGDVSMLESNTVMGKVYFTRKEYQNALKHLLAVPYEAREYDKESYNVLQLLKAECYAALGDWKNASIYYRDFAFTKDTLLSEAGKQNIAEMEARYQNKQKQQRINILDIENKLQAASIANARKQQVMLIGGIVLLSLILLLLYINYRNKQRNARILDEKNAALQEANKTKATLFSVISHDLRSPISQLYQYLQLQQHHPGLLDEEKKKMHSERISNATASLLETMEDMLVWSKTQMDRFVPASEQVAVNDVVKDTITLLSPDSEAKSLNIVNDTTPNALVWSDTNLLKIIVRNLLQNAIQYSLPGSAIYISAQQAPGVLALTLKDEGLGMSDELIATLKAGEKTLSSDKKGLGWALVMDMATSIGVSISIAKNHPQGTIITLTVPDRKA